MPEPLDGAAVEEAGAVLQRLVGRIEDGTLGGEDATTVVVAASWQGAANALALAAKGQPDNADEK